MSASVDARREDLERRIEELERRVQAVMVLLYALAKDDEPEAPPTLEEQYRAKRMKSRGLESFGLGRR